MTPAPVGQRCPEHSGKAQGVARMTKGVRRAGYEGTGALVTRTLIAINVAVYLAQIGQGAGLTPASGSIFEKGVLYGPAVAQGDWWRLITSMFLHASLLHIGMNMVVLWIIGAPVEAALGRGRFLLLYLVSGLAGSTGALLWSPTTPTLGASGAIFGILGAALILERQRTYVLGGQAVGLLVVNLVFTFAIPNISIGAHVGGLAGGALAALALSRFGRGHAIYGRLGLVGVAGVLAIAAASVALAYWKVRGYA
jgi:membrane associated rhomboid family serine protease